MSTEIRRLHIALNVELRRLGCAAPACDGPDCSICRVLASPPGQEAPPTLTTQAICGVCRNNGTVTVLTDVAVCPECYRHVLRDCAELEHALDKAPWQEAPQVKEEDLSRVDRSALSQGLDLPRNPQPKGSQ